MFKRDKDTVSVDVPGLDGIIQQVSELGAKVEEFNTGLKDLVEKLTPKK